jgi:hypothetical protein
MPIPKLGRSFAFFVIRNHLGRILKIAFWVDRPTEFRINKLLKKIYTFIMDKDAITPHG